MPSPPRVPPGLQVHVVGIGADGWSGLAQSLRSLVLSAPILLGGPRHLALVPPCPGQRREPWPSPLRAGLPALLASLDSGLADGSADPSSGAAGDAASPQVPVVVLASGDPLVAGIGSTLIDLLGADRVRIHPGVSSLALARATLGWPAESCAVVRVGAGSAAPVLRELAPGRRVLVLSADETTPDEVARLLREAGYGASALHILGDLGSEQFTQIDTTADAWADLPGTAPRLHVLGVTLSGPASGGPGASWVAGLPDTAYEHDGQLTKRDLRASALARLAPTPGGHLWDVGAGAGSIGIEWMRAHRTCTASAVEVDPRRAARIVRNAAALGVPGLQVITGAAPDALAGLPVPTAIFIGGGAQAPGVLDRCLAALPPGGRLVIHAVTVQTERLLGELYAAHGGELTRIGVEVAAPIGSFTGWTPSRTVTQWAFTRGV